MEEKLRLRRAAGDIKALQHLIVAAHQIWCHWQNAAEV
jgi:hypothetical protein